jgi:hypothetical protein
MTDYEVGFGKPPEHSRFKKGQSGNPRGRPRRPTHAVPEMHEAGMKEIILVEAYRLVDIHEGGKETRLPLIQVIIRQLAVSAAQGSRPAMNYFIETLGSIEEGRRSKYEAYYKAMMTYKEVVGEEFERRRKLNPSEPAPVPHPDDIIDNMATGTIEVRGPMTKEEQVLWDRIEETDSSIAELQGMLAKDPDNPHNKFIEKDLAVNKRRRQLLGRAVPDYRPRPSRQRARLEARQRAFKSFLEELDLQRARRSHRKSPRKPRDK